MKNERSLQLVTLCINLARMQLLATYKQVADALGISVKELKELLKTISFCTGAAIVDAYADGDGKVLKHEQNIYREDWGFTHLRHSNKNSKRYSVIPNKPLFKGTNEDLVKIMNEKPIRLIINSDGTLVHVKLTITSKLILSEKPRLKTYNGILYLNLKNGFLLQDLEDSMTKNINSKRTEWDRDNAPLDVYKIQNKVGGKFTNLNDNIKEELKKYVGSLDNDTDWEPFLFSTLEAKINIGALIEIKREQ